jgi:hypothetical protein
MAAASFTRGQQNARFPPSVDVCSGGTNPYFLCISVPAAPPRQYSHRVSASKIDPSNNKREETAKITRDKIDVILPVQTSKVSNCFRLKKKGVSR